MIISHTLKIVLQILALFLYQSYHHFAPVAVALICVFFSWKGPCLEYLLQYKILDTLHTLGRADVGICFTTITVSKKLNCFDIYF